MRRRPQRRRILTFRRFLLLIIILSLVVLIVSKTYFRPPIMAYAKQKSQYYASVLINDAIVNNVLPEMDTNKIVFLETKSNGVVTSVVIDVYQINKLSAKLTSGIQKEMLVLEEDQAGQLNSLKVPLGVMFDNPVLNGMGPKIPIRLRIVGSVNTDIVSKVTPYGINNSLVEINVITKVTFQVMIPFQKGEFLVVTHTPLFVKIIQGSVPHYYYTGGNGYFSNPPVDTSGADSTLLEQ